VPQHLGVLGDVPHRRRRQLLDVHVRAADPLDEDVEGALEEESLLKLREP